MVAIRSCEMLDLSQNVLILPFLIHTEPPIEKSNSLEFEQTKYFDFPMFRKQSNRSKFRDNNTLNLLIPPAIPTV